MHQLTMFLKVFMCVLSFRCACWDLTVKIGVSIITHAHIARWKLRAKIWNTIRYHEAQACISSIVLKFQDAYCELCPNNGNVLYILKRFLSVTIGTISFDFITNSSCVLLYDVIFPP